MGRFEGPDGKVVEADNAVAEAYYERDPDFTRITDTAPQADVPASVTVDGPPAKSASKREWYDYAATLEGVELPPYDDITHDELVEDYGGE